MDKDKQEIRKILCTLVKYPKPNLPTIAVLMTCCFIDAISGKIGNKFEDYVKKYMVNTYNQLKDNDTKKSIQIKEYTRIYCSFHKRGKRTKNCSDSMDILFHHVRCGLVHNYFGNEIVYINRPNKNQLGIIVDQSRKFQRYSLVINESAFVYDFINSLSLY